MRIFGIISKREWINGEGAELMWIECNGLNDAVQCCKEYYSNEPVYILDSSNKVIKEVI